MSESEFRSNVMSDRPKRVTRSWRYLQPKSSTRPNGTGAFFSLYLAALALIAVYYLFR